MNEYVIVLEMQYNYVSSLLRDRSNFSTDNLLDDIEFEGNSPYLLFKHAIIAIHHFASQNFFPKEFGNRKDIFNDNSSDLVVEIIEKYRFSLNEFKRAINEISEDKYDEIKENIGNLVMHVVGHIGQGIRLQKMNINSLLKTESTVNI